jgi:tetratricopeptide (TPR) repeat protein
MLEPVRQYARERLEVSGKADAVRGRHAEFFLALAERAAPELKGPRQVVWLKVLDREQDDLRTAMAWLLGKGEVEAAVRFGWALWRFWRLNSRLTEGRRRMEEALARGSTMPAGSRARALFIAGTMAEFQGDRWSAQPLLEESLKLFRELGDKQGAAYALGSAGLVAVGQERHEEGIALFEESVDLILEVDDRWAAAFLTLFSGVGWLRRGDHAQAKRLAERGLAFSRETGDRHGTSIALYLLAGLALAKRDYERATRLFEEGLELSAEVEDEAIIAYSLKGLANVAGAEGREVRAAHLWGAAETLLKKIEAAAPVYAPDPSH